jgi:hypothetical protein
VVGNGNNGSSCQCQQGLKCVGRLRLESMKIGSQLALESVAFGYSKV